MKGEKTPITGNDLADAIQKLRMLKFFPTTAEGAVMELLAKICRSYEALAWLSDTLVNHVGEWPGPAEVRGLLCTHDKPADGIEGYCTLAGFSPADFEAKHANEHAALKAGAWSEDALKMLEDLPKPKRLT